MMNYHQKIEFERICGIYLGNVHETLTKYIPQETHPLKEDLDKEFSVLRESLFNLFSEYSEF